jgi:ATPase subunit of ABC transporter with duplicated ATPase domains
MAAKSSPTRVNCDFYERERAVRESNQQAAFARQQSMLAKEQRFIDRFRTHAAKATQVQSRIGCAT